MGDRYLSAMRMRQRLAALVMLACLLLAGCRLDADPDPTVELTWWVTYAQETGEYAAAKQVLQTAVTHDTSDPDLRYALGEALRRNDFPGSCNSDEIRLTGLLTLC